MLLTKGNSKLGESIWAWNLPAIDTCPGRTPQCSTACYAMQNRWKFASVRSRLLRNGRAALHPEFANAMTHEIQTHEIASVRIHGSGDLFAEHYVVRWAKIINRCRETRFLAYTRSWRVPSLRDAIESLLVPCNNLSLWYSADVGSGLPEKMPERVRVAWLQAERSEAIPPGVDLVFRTHELRKQPAKRIGLTLVCPRENGTPAGQLATCSTCSFCL